MKKLCLILCLCLLLTLAGCKRGEMPDPVVPEAANSTTEAPTEAPTETEPVTVAKPEDPVPVNEVETKYYSLDLPDEWKDSCVVEIFEMESGLYVLSLSEVTAFEEFGGGNLCSIQLMPTGDDTYKDFPSYEWLGELDTPDGRLNVIVLFPTDVQFSENAVEAYTEMFDQIHDVLFTLSPTEGVELAMPAPTA